MTDQATGDPIGDTSPETARALLWRHGLPEDVIDGALALHAQELAETIRAAADRPRKADESAMGQSLRRTRYRAAADLIDPTTGAVVPVVPVSSPPPDQTADRAAVYREIADRLTTDAQHGMQPDWARIYKRDAANKVREWAAEMAAEAQQSDTETQAHPPQNSWRVETRDPLADQWAPGSRFAHRPAAVERWETANRTAPLWRDGTPVERRIVRETTTYTVEQPTAANTGEEADA